jgi:hypothetical protein
MISLHGSLLAPGASGIGPMGKSRSGRLDLSRLVVGGTVPARPES